MYQLIYASRPFGYDTATLAAILATSRQRNPQDDITGALICRQDVYLQLLEGPQSRVETTFERIRKDDRHIEVRTLVRSPTVERLFPKWAMWHDPAASWHYSAREVARGALDRASVLDIRMIFLRAANSAS